VCSYYEVKPSQNDLLNHMVLMGEAATRDAVLAKSKVNHLMFLFLSFEASFWELLIQKMV
jgi:hypothetical protein